MVVAMSKTDFANGFHPIVAAIGFRFCPPDKGTP
jgi:hypothetical protein